jgi:hypothetical protein
MRQTEEEMIAALQASIDGETMQIRPHDFDEEDCFTSMPCEPNWDFSTLEYRAKPKQKQCWVAFSSAGVVCHAITDEKDKLTHYNYTPMTEQL